MANNIKVVDIIEEGKQEENETVEPIPEEVLKMNQSLKMLLKQQRKLQTNPLYK